METAEDRKQRYIQDIMEAHPIYKPDSYIAQETAKRLQRLPEQPIFYLWHLAKAVKK